MVSEIQVENATASSPQKIVMMADWLPPEFGAVGQYAMQFAEELAVAGHHVLLVGFSSQAASETKESKSLGELTVRRIFRPKYDRGNFLSRAWWTFWANVRLLVAAFPEFRRADEIRFTGSPPYLLHFVMPMAWLFQRKTRYRITDFHPECLFAALGKAPLWSRPLLGMTRYWRRRVSVMEVIGCDQARRLRDSGVLPHRIELKRDASPVVFQESMTPAELPTALVGRKVILYSGNWGQAHAYESFAKAIETIERRFPGQVGVWLNATGKQVPAVVDALKQSGMAWAHTPPCALSKLPSVLLAADLQLITLYDAFVGYVLPSKVYACVDSKKPVLFVGSAKSDVHLLCEQGVEKYRRVDVENVEALIESMVELLELKDDGVGAKNGSAMNDQNNRMQMEME